MKKLRKNNKRSNPTLRANVVICECNNKHVYFAYYNEHVWGFYPKGK
ncbi:hypothetical protein PV797_16070 [Clostridiaceae bacterium M8S5]|nr:hypothetical protein PV797_16070 [Clostridiaceae bacterium M8S5]